jgi:hydroxypyruvate isomerase
MVSTVLRDRIANARRAGRVDIGEVSRQGHSSVEAADAAAEAAGAKAIGAAWRTIPQEAARSLIRTALVSDLAYNARCMADAEAQNFVNEVVGLVREPVEFLTNVERIDWLGVVDGAKLRASSFTPLTAATFSAAVAVLGRDRVAVIVVSDED